MFRVILLVGIALMALFTWSAFRRFKRYDKNFEELAADSARRRTAIATLARFRTLAYVMAAFVGLVAVVVTYLQRDADSARHAPLFFGATAILWAFGHKYDSDMRLLTLIEKLEKHEKTAV